MFIEISFKNRDGLDSKETYPLSQLKKIRPWHIKDQNPLTFIVVEDLERKKMIDYIIDIPYGVFTAYLSNEDIVWQISSVSLNPGQKMT